MTEDEMIGWHHRLNGHEFEQTPGDGEGPGSLACYSHSVTKSGTRLSDWTTTVTHQQAQSHTQRHHYSSKTIRDQKVGGGPIPGNLHSFPQTAGIILPLISLWNYPPHKSWPHHISRLHSPSGMAYTLVCEVCFSQINPLLTYHFVSH